MFDEGMKKITHWERCGDVSNQNAGEIWPPSLVKCFPHEFPSQRAILSHRQHSPLGCFFFLTKCKQQNDPLRWWISKRSMVKVMRSSVLVICCTNLVERSSLCQNSINCRRIQKRVKDLFVQFTITYLMLS